MALTDRPAFRRIQESLEQRTGVTVASSARVEALEEAAVEYGAVRRELDMLGWQVMDYFSGRPQEMAFQKRRELAQKARMIWLDDANAGAAVSLMNDFVFGRGVPRPEAADDEVQKVIDEAWDDPDNQLVLTSYDAQVRLGIDLQIQANIFLLLFDEDEGVKLTLLDHDSVENATRDDDNRMRVLYYLARERKVEWDYEQDKPKDNVTSYTEGKVLYYEHWRNVDDLEEAGGKRPEIPEAKQGKGRVYHVAINRTSEMVFGIPEFRRTLRWFSAYNEFLRARVDMAQAAAAFVMKRKVKGTPNQVVKSAAKAMSRESLLGGTTGVGDSPAQQPGRSGKILTENENVSHESMKLDTGSAGAAQDAQTLRSVISAATRFPQHYLGDAGSANLATATAMELPVLKAVESRQEVFEGIFRWFIDRVIEKAVEDGRLSETVEPEAVAIDGGGSMDTVAEAHEDRGEDEEETQRDLSYELSMPNPLRRMMGEFVGAIANIARTFDPNNSNPELSRVLLGLTLGQGLEVENPSDLVDRIFPPGYVDPAIAAAQAAAESAQRNAPGGTPTPAQPGGNTSENPYGAKMKGTNAEDNPYGMSEAVEAIGPLLDRDGEPLPLRLQPHMLMEARFRRALPASAEADTQREVSELDAMWSEDVEAIAADALDRAMLMHGTNGTTPTKGDT